MAGSSSGNDIFYGGEGNNCIDAGSANEVVFGGDGNDTLEGGNHTRIKDPTRQY